MNLKFLFPLLGVASGIFIYADIWESYWVPVISIVLSFATWISLTHYSKNPITGRKISPLHSIWVYLLFGGIGSLDYSFFSAPPSGFNHMGEPLSIIGTIEDIQTLANGDRYKVKIIEIRDSLNHRVDCRNIDMQLRTDGFSANMGDKLEFPAILKTFASFTPDNSYSARMKHQGLDFYSNVKSEEIKRIGKVFSLDSYFNEWRSQLIIKIEKCSLSKETSDFLISVLLGDRSYLKDDIRTSLSSAGLAHILALSGMHVGIVLSIILIILFPLSLIGFNKVSKIIALLLIWLYVGLTGASSATIRAAIMASLVLGAYLFQRKNSALNALLAAATIILLVDPLALWDIGMQLSFLCVGSILIFVNKLNPMDHHKHPRLFKIINLFLISLVTTFATWVLISYYFGEVPLLFLPANLIILPLLPFFLGGAIFFISFLLLGYDFSYFAKILDFFYYNIISLADTLSLNKNAVVELETPGILVMVWLAGVLIIGVSLYSSLRKRRYLLMGAGFSLFLLFGIFMLRRDDNEGNLSKLKFLHNFTSLQAKFLDNKEITKLEFPRGSISELDYDNLKITAIDQIIRQDSLNCFKNENKTKPHFIFLGSNASFEQIAQIINTNEFDGIILHSAIGKNKKAELLRLLEEPQWDKIYSLREIGSLEFSL